MYDLELDRVADEIRERGARRVLLQLPDGLRPHAFEMAREIREKTGAEVVLSGDSCYGACDLATRPAREIEADLLIHYGHNIIIRDPGVPVLYVEARIDIDVEDLVEAALPHLGEWRTIGLAATVQHTHQLGEVADALEARGVRAVTGKGGGKTPYDGQALGCSYGAARVAEEEVEGYLFIGGGRFHPIGLALATGKPVVTADPYSAAVSKLDEGEVMRLAKKRYANIVAARSSRLIGVLVSLKPGQHYPLVGSRLVERLGERGYESLMIVLDEVRGENLDNFSEVDAFVNTACPRISIDGISGVSRPILTVLEAQVMLGEREWEKVWGSGYLSYDDLPE